MISATCRLGPIWWTRSSKRESRTLFGVFSVALGDPGLYAHRFWMGAGVKFDLIDSVLEQSDEHIVALKQVSRAEEYLADHFPGCGLRTYRLRLPADASPPQPADLGAAPASIENDASVRIF